MLNRRGFTVVELVVVMVIMAILLVLAGLSLSKSQANARDAERKSDTEVLARGFEARYTQGKLNAAVTTAPSYVKAGTYPSTDEMRHITGQSVSGFIPVQITGGYGPTALPGTSLDAFAPPNVSGYSGLTLSTCSTSVEDTTGYCLQNATTPSAYVYEPINASGGLCVNDAAGCVRFNLYWRLETGAGDIQQYRSKHQ